MRRIAYDGGQVGTGVLQLGSDQPGLYIQAIHWFKLNLAIQLLLEAAGAESLQRDPVLLEAIMKIYGTWDSIGGESFIKEALTAALPHRSVTSYQNYIPIPPPCIECEKENTRDEPSSELE